MGRYSPVDTDKDMKSTLLDSASETSNTEFVIGRISPVDTGNVITSPLGDSFVATSHSGVNPLWKQKVGNPRGNRKLVMAGNKPTGREFPEENQLNENFQVGRI